MRQCAHGCVCSAFIVRSRGRKREYVASSTAKGSWEARVALPPRRCNVTRRANGLAHARNLRAACFCACDARAEDKRVSKALD